MKNIDPIRAYFLAYGSNKLLCESETSSDPEEERRIIGAFVPGVDGNYYKNVLVGFVGEDEREYTPGFASWWKWCKDSIKREETLIDDEFCFDPDGVRVISVDLNLTLPPEGIADDKSR